MMHKLACAAQLFVVGYWCISHDAEFATVGMLVVIGFYLSAIYRQREKGA
jgi:hypothetical protein